MYRRRDTKVVSIISAFAIGGLIGAGIALLMAPQSGYDTRMAIRSKSNELRDKAASRVEDTRERARDRLEDIAEKTRDTATNLRRRGKDVVESTR